MSTFDAKTHAPNTPHRSSWRQWGAISTFDAKTHALNTPHRTSWRQWGAISTFDAKTHALNTRAGDFRPALSQ
jgi:hypothetical protein